MSSIAGKQLLVGVTGGIAAYKSVELVRRLNEAGASVRVVMTRAAQEFITPLTLQAVSGHPVRDSLLDPDAEAGMSHIEMARWADHVIVAPATADFIARLAAGIADDLLTTLCLATEAPVGVAPAMNRGMWDNPATRANIETLKQRGIALLGPDAGAQACGEIGEGRMIAPEEIISCLDASSPTQLLHDLTVVVTAGPTLEPLDPVRALTNHSSGKMGYAVAAAAINAGRCEPDLRLTLRARECTDSRHRRGQPYKRSINCVSPSNPRIESTSIRRLMHLDCDSCSTSSSMGSVSAVFLVFNCTGINSMVAT